MSPPSLLSGELESFLNTFPLMENRNSEHNDIQMANTGAKFVKNQTLNNQTSRWPASTLDLVPHPQQASNTLSITHRMGQKRDQKMNEQGDYRRRISYCLIGFDQPMLRHICWEIKED